MTLGEKIRYYRKKASLTQAQLAGDHMTRNMLSQIENGSAKPSLATIEYLTRRLDLPCGFLLTEKNDIGEYDYLKTLQEYKTLYKNGEYKRIVEKAERYDGDFSDEISAMLADCYLSLGKSEYRSGDMPLAEKHFYACISYCGKTVYNTDDLKNTAKLYMNLINFYFGKYAGDFVDFSDDSSFGNDCLCEYLYVYCLKLIETGGAEHAIAASELPIFSNECFVMHIYARYEMSKGNYAEAKQIMTELLGYPASEHTAQLLYNVYSDMESICRSGEDYKNAYKYAKLKGDLYSAIIHQV
ncbi:MAG: helix-turn-helix transcriptional regulator [Clostridia bacterium]|nr:helix-turn-helix transcriptional regulator [Clostridia bacterium]